MLHPPNILTIAGSDSGGGAGIQADLKTIMANGGYGMSVITALTAQNGLGVNGIHAPDADFVALQLRTVLDGFAVAAIKTGMLFSADIIMTVGAMLREQVLAHVPNVPLVPLVPLVVDPVSVSQTGSPLLRKDAVAALIEHIVPLADLLTPNRPEAELLAQMQIETEDDIAAAAQRLLALGAKAVLIKGGHFSHSILVTDWLCLPNEPPLALRQAHVDTPHTHGTGCTLSAAIATFLGLGLPLRVAVSRAQEYLNMTLRKAYAPGKGCGPVNHAAGLR